MSREGGVQVACVVDKGFSAFRIDGHCGGPPAWLDVQCIARCEAMAVKNEPESLPFLVVGTRHQIARVDVHEPGRGSGKQRGGDDPTVSLSLY